MALSAQIPQLGSYIEASDVALDSSIFGKVLSETKSQIVAAALGFQRVSIGWNLPKGTTYPACLITPISSMEMEGEGTNISSQTDYRVTLSFAYSTDAPSDWLDNALYLQEQLRKLFRHRTFSTPANWEVNVEGNAPVSIEQTRLGKWIVGGTLDLVWRIRESNN